MARNNVFKKMKMPGLIGSEVPENLDSAMEIAHEENPRILIARKATYLAREEIKSTRSDFYPKVDIVTNYSHKKNTDAVNGRRRDFSVVVKSTWKVFSGFIITILTTHYYQPIMHKISYFRV